MDRVNEYLTETLEFEDLGTGRRWQKVRPRIVCGDGVSLSVQAGEYLYSQPRADGAMPYTHVEVGFPSIIPPLSWKEYAEEWTDSFWEELAKFLKSIWTWTRLYIKPFIKGTRGMSGFMIKNAFDSLFLGSPCNTVYAYIPVELVNWFIIEHGGIDKEATYGEPKTEQNGG